MTPHEKRIKDLERRVKELEAAPRENHIHWHTHPPIHVPDWTWRPQPHYPPNYPWWNTTVAMPTSTIPYTLTNVAGTIPA